MSASHRIYLDSSIFIGAAIPGSNHSVAAGAFCQRLAAEGATVVYSSIMRYEYAHIAQTLARPDSRRRIPTDIVSDFDLGDWDDDIVVRRRWMEATRENLERLLSQFAFAVEVPVRSEIWNDALDLMIEFQLRSYDALHVASARWYNVNDIAASDRHFADVTGFNVTIVRDS